ncbi:hypothetical protein [Sphingobium yanoikuyae]|uniref:hypothetical protein n=1 Tax=Sphingobium yanoikuyae TaxID=13690 RepID=UPI00345EF4E6
MSGRPSFVTALLFSVVARQGPALAGRTLLTCEFVSHEDRKALDSQEGDAP